ncbi:hypothetical protein F5B19DRAFT_151601 [Rostrohypoxylon terebratum]|nr:hypothetical protein F5B19DRAFT_151601 [Rostrohypoxylon terebratum]
MDHLHGASSWGELATSKSKLSDSAAKLFDGDEVVLIDIEDTATVKRVCTALLKSAMITDTHQACRRALGGGIDDQLETMKYMVHARQRKAICDLVRVDYKLSWLRELYHNGRVPGLPSSEPDWAGWDRQKLCYSLNWDETDPVVKGCIDKMPQLRFVYIIMIRDDANQEEVHVDYSSWGFPDSGFDSWDH